MKNRKNERPAESSLSNDTFEHDLQGEVMEVWEAMHFDFESVEEPSGLKEEVLNFVFNQESGDNKQTEKERFHIKSIWKQFTPFTASFCAVMLLCIVLLVFPIHQPGIGVNEIVASMKLNAVDEELGEAYGYAFLINKNGKEELIINVYDFPQIQGKEVYQVWMIDNGRRQSAGVFKSDKEGFGVLTVDTSKLDAFDTIGITLEPDATSKQPRGKKIVGTG